MDDYAKLFVVGVHVCTHIFHLLQLRARNQFVIEHTQLIEGTAIAKAGGTGYRVHMFEGFHS